MKANSLVWLTTALLLAMAAGNVADAQRRGQAPPNMPSEAEMRQQMLELMGKSDGTAPTSDDAGVQIVIQTGHAAPITAVGESVDGRIVVSGGMDETIKVWDVASGQEARTIAGQGLLWPRAIAVADDGALAVVAEFLTARIYDLKSGTLLHQWWTRGNSLPLVSRDARWLVGEFDATQPGNERGSSRPSGGIQVWDTATGAATWAVPAGPVARTLALSGNGRWLVTRSQPQRADEGGGDLDVWDVAGRRHTGRCAASAVTSQQQPAVTAGQGEWTAAISDDGRTLALESADRGTVQLMDVVECQKLRSLPTHLPSAGGATTTLVFAPAGDLLAWAVSGGVSHLWRVADGSEADAPAVAALQWRADGNALVYGLAGGGAPVIRDPATGADTALAAGAAEVADIVVVGNGEAAVAAMQDGSARWWDLATGDVRRSFACAAGTATSSVAIDRGETALAVGCADGSALLWDLRGMQAARTLLQPLPNTFVPVIVRFTPDGATVIAARRDELTLIDAASGVARRTLTIPPAAESTLQGEQSYPEEQWIRAVAIHPREPWVAVGQSHAIGIWNLLTGERVVNFQGTSVLEKMGLGSLGGMPGMPGMPMSLPSGRGGRSGAMPPSMSNPMAAMQSMNAMTITGAQSLTFSPEGARLVSMGSMGRQVWDAQSGKEIVQAANTAALRDPQHGLESLMSGLLGGGAAGTTVGTRAVAVSPDGRLIAQCVGHRVRVFDAATLEKRADLDGHTADVTAVDFSRDGSTLVTGAKDGSLRIWDAKQLKERAALIALGAQDSIAVTPDHYYRASRSRLQGVAFRTGGVLYPFDQFDVRFNRPDIVLAALGRAPADVVKSYRLAYQRRLQRMGFSEQMMSQDLHLPEIELLTEDVPVTTPSTSLTVKVRAHDERVPLDRVMVYVNDVPIDGRAGRAIAGKVHRAEMQLDVPLIGGRNKIQLSVLNQDGIESLRRTVYTTQTAAETRRDVWVVAIGVSHYLNSRYDLRFAAKDASDLADAFAGRAGAAVHVLPITDDKATRDGVRAARQWLASARTDDLAIVFAAGHGMIDADQDYYFGTYDIDPGNPARAGLPFGDFESLLDGIHPLRKLLLVDTCFSGEIERDTAAAAPAAPGSGAAQVTMRSFKAMRGIAVSADESRPQAIEALPVYARFQQDLFADLRRGTGAVVISSASGNEFALEGDAWHNGVFTYALIDGLRNGKADRNHDGTVTATELESYVIDAVRQLTAGKQNPTVRRENVDFDFSVY